MPIVKLIRYVVSYNNLEIAMKSLHAAGVKDLKHYSTLKIIDGYYFGRKRKELEKLDGVETASANIPNLQEFERNDSK